MLSRRAATVVGSSLLAFVFLFASLACLVTGCASSASAGGTGGSTGATGGRIGTGGAGQGGGAGSDAGAALPSCAPTTAVDALILDFSNFKASSNQAMFGVFGTSFAGGTYQYPRAITSNFTAGNWHIIGTVTDYSGFGLYLSCKSNVAAFTGIQMDVSGTFTGNGGDDGGISPARVTMGISQPADELATAFSAMPTWGTCSAHCSSPSREVLLPATTMTVTLPWASFTGGTPVGPLDPAAITGIFFVFPWSGASTAQYTVDVTIDNIRFFGRIE
ncbi:MAG TPA: hypothetical protein VFH68_06045, partial [Polyangia bacterium]|nr:hypothetical protein [Polyangia bacterium]